MEHLTQAVESYKQRMDWLTSNSRQIFGVILEQCITIVLDFGGMLEEELNLSPLGVWVAQSVSEEREGAAFWWKNVADTTVVEVRSASPVAVMVAACGPGVMA